MTLRKILFDLLHSRTLTRISPFAKKYWQLI